ncbi:store-operated calcium entry regulator STIMATE-like isoform X2 [Sitodiplosis mosellana]|uniref:store-operated calcium entry regulator STIMATE-like isoform X2 n=1 Tax=Sitodiplosis mosellana TaxID=263140 RepID=UPI00244415D2|nr:store-operated calcium entry regulator STIMATE-like isoform X2 [Sitodiplosis mosellana]XP_055321065.1 store-operated calcium entry regulator STIMATE-like isoform X2 [Sitodiplosis mosellana]
MVNNDNELDHCSKDALTGFLGLVLQAVLAGLAFTCLIAKRFREPPGVRRPWQVWWYDTSKQGIGAIVIHLTNVYLAKLFQGDPCTWYVINFLLDSTIGLLIVFIGIRLCQFLAFYKKWPAINFGVYDAPKSWIYQTCIYIGLMALVKIATTLFIQWKFWEGVKNLVLSPFSNATLEITLVMLVIPFFVNLLIFWVTDNFLMRHDHQQHKRSFLINYVSKLNKHQTNGFTNGTNAPQYANGNGSLNANGDERFDVEFTDDDCVALEPRDPRLNL